MAHSFNKILEL